MRTRVVLALFSITLSTSVAAQSALQAQADAAWAKLQAVMLTAGPPTRPPAASRRTIFSQAEMNAYLRYRAGTWLPAGLTEPSVQFIGANRIATLVTADLDGVRKKSAGGWFDPTTYLSGRLPVYVTGTLSTASGRGRFVLEQATVDGVPVPRLFIDELLAFYTRSADNPAGVRLDEPFELPSEIERIDVAAGQATVVQ
ncbi:MAG: hypothetical protein KA371_07405 [Acidobacteria bacterium]|nr:hypothetical protein [Acidobacteriota bacterium]